MTVVSLVRHTVELGNDTLAEINDRRSLAIIYISPAGEVNDLRVIPSDLEDLDQVILARNGDLLISGRFRNYEMEIGERVIRSASSPAYFTARINQAGSVEWAEPVVAELKWRSVGDAYGLLETREGDVIMSVSPGGYNWSINGCADDPHFFSLASFNGNTGNLNWQREIATHGFGFISNLAEAPNGDLYAAGRYGGQLRAGNGEEIITGNRDCGIESSFVIKLTPEGSVYDLVPTPPNNFVVSGFELFSDGSYALAGWVANRAEATPSSLERGFALLHFDAYDRLLSETNLTKPGEGIGAYRIQTTSLPDKTLILTGLYRGSFLSDVFGNPETNFFASGKMFIGKVKLLSASTPETGLPAEDITVFPNPATNTLNISTPKGGAAELAISLFDAAGRRVRYYPPAKDRSQHTIDLRQLPTGAYVLRLGEQARGLTYPIIKRKE